MKKFNKIFMIAFAMFLSLCGIEYVDASTYNGRLYENYYQTSGVNVFATDTTGNMDYNGWFIESTIDNRIYYCIEPELALDGALLGSHNYITGKDNIISSSRLTQSTFNKVRLLAYYGYGYKDSNVDHTSKKWYGITQVMIWRVVRTDLDWTFKDGRYGSKDASLFVDKVNEMNRLVNNHLTKPSFSNNNINMIINDKIELTDTNKVLSNYDLVSSSSNVSVKKTGNKLELTANKTGKVTLNFEKKSRTSLDFALLTSNDFQDVVAMGSADPSTFSLSVEIIGGTINLQKIDGTTEKAIAQGEATLKGSVYGVYNTKNELVGKITTDDNGKGKLSLDFGTYIIKEITAPKGYKLSDKVYSVNLTKSNDEVNVNVSDKVITGKVLLTKKKGGSGEEFVIEANASFDIIDKNGEIVEKLITNEKGMSIAVLPYGAYTIHQTSGDDGYIFADDIKIELYEEKIYEIDIKNLKLSKLIFTKTDYSSDKPLPNTKIEIYKENDELIFTGVTDENGQIEVPNLEIGKYYILEKEAPKYYRLNEEKMYFEVKANGEIIKTTMKDHRKEGNLEFTKTDYSGKKLLPNAYIEIYFTETKELVFKGKTDKTGKIKLEGLIAGKYCIVEKKAPNGYELSKEPIYFEILEENETVKVSMKNKESKVVVKDTGSSNIDIFQVIGISLVIGGIVYAIYEKKKH